MKIGILGGGQLGMMMAESAIKRHHIVYALDTTDQAPIKPYCEKLFHHGFSKQVGYQRLYESCDVLTYEFENVSLDWVHAYVDKIPQKTKALEISRHRHTEKEFASELNIPTPAYEIFRHDQVYQYPFILKTTTLGYDGHGQFVIRAKEDLLHVKDLNQKEYIKEEMIHFDYEISIILTRDQFGHIAYFPVPRNIHKNGILFVSIIDDLIPEEIQNQAKDYAKRIVNSLSYVGTLAVEFFIVGSQVLFNEFAPRPHNSGHYSIEGCQVSQFDNHILAITNQHVIEPKLKETCAMVNILGKNLHLIEQYKDVPNIYIHMYNKREPRPDRKMGHLTIVGKNYKKILAEITGEEL